MSAGAAAVCKQRGYLIDESSFRHDGFINTGFFARAKNYHAFRWYVLRVRYSVKVLVTKSLKTYFGYTVGELIEIN